MKIILILQISLLMILSACSYDESLQVSEMESSLEMLAVETTAKLTETVTVTVTTSSAIINRSKQLNLGKIDKWSFNSRFFILQIMVVTIRLKPVDLKIRIMKMLVMIYQGMMQFIIYV